MTRLLLSALAGGLAANLAMLLTFRTLGFGWDGQGLLVTAPGQSAKLVAVWTQIEPLPLAAVDPLPILVGMTLFALGHAWIYRSISQTWPTGLWPRALRLAGLILFMSYAFFEFFTPFNMFREPLWLIAIEMGFWATMALAEALAIVAVLQWRKPA